MIINKHKRAKYLRKYQKDFMDKLLQDGFLKPIKKPNDWVWGVKSFTWPDGYVNEIQGRFLGGGVHESYGYEVKLGDKVFRCYHWGYATKCAYGYIVKYHT